MIVVSASTITLQLPIPTLKIKNLNTKINKKHLLNDYFPYKTLFKAIKLP